MALSTEFQDDILDSSMDGVRRYSLIENDDGTVSLEDASTYTQVGSDFNAKEVNTITEAVNENTAGLSALSDTVTTLEETVSNIALSVYPVGSIYMSVNSTDPSTLFGGTWTQLQDRFLLGAGSSYTNGATGGASTVTLTTSNLPAHTHSTPNHTHTISNYSKHHRLVQSVDLGRFFRRWNCCEQKDNRNTEG